MTVAFAGWMTMNNSVFNTTFEFSMRALLLLSLVKNKGLTLDSLITADFIANYSKEFGLSNNNLHGDNEFSFSELSARRVSVQNAIKELVLENMIQVSHSKYGFQYSISNRGQAFCDDLTSDYASEYRVYAKKAIIYMNSMNEIEILNLISKSASKSIRKG